MYEPGQPPGLTIEHLFDEEFVLVTSAPGRRRHHSDYVFVDWGPDFQADHAAAYPELEQHRRQPRSGLDGASTICSPTRPPATSRAGSSSITSPAAGCASRRGRARSPAAVYMVYPETRDEEAYEPILEGLRQAAAAADRVGRPQAVGSTSKPAGMPTTPSSSTVTEVTLAAGGPWRQRSIMSATLSARAARTRLRPSRRGGCAPTPTAPSSARRPLDPVAVADALHAAVDADPNAARGSPPRLLPGPLLLVDQ